MSAWIDDFIKINRYSRPGTKLTAKRKGILHFTGNNGAGAKNHVTYFGKSMIEQNEKLPESQRRFASAHIFVDKTEARCIVPLDEVAYAANDVQQKNKDGSAWRGISELLPNANLLSVSVEMCQEADGSFHPNTIARTEDVFVDLSKMFKWDPLEDIVRHYDVTHKNCPAPWVSNGQAFIDFKNRVNNKLKGVDVDMLEKAIVIGGFPDFAFAEVLAARLKAPVYTRSALPSEKIAKEVYVVGGTTDGIQGDKVISLTGATRFDVAAAVKKFLG